MSFAPKPTPTAPPEQDYTIEEWNKLNAPPEPAQSDQPQDYTIEEWNAQSNQPPQDYTVEQYNALQQVAAPPTITEAGPAGYWASPVNVGKFYEQIRSIPQGDAIPDWINVDAITAAAQYYERLNGTKDWTQWANLPPGDPILMGLNALPDPPSEFLSPSDLAKAPPKQNLLGSGYPGFGTTEEGVMVGGEPQYYGMTKEQWDSIGVTRQWGMRFQGAGSGFQGAAMGVASGGGIPGALMGGLMGAGMSLDIDPATGQPYPASRVPLAQVDNVPLVGDVTVYQPTVRNVPAGLMRAVAWLFQQPSELLQRGLGTAGFITEAAVNSAGITQTPDVNRPTLPEVLNNIGVAWDLSRELYRVGGNVSRSNLRPGAPKPMEAWEFGTTNVKTLAPEETGWQALNAAFQQATKERKPMEEIYQELAQRYGWEGDQRYLIGTMVLDPLPLLPHAAVKGIGLIGKVADLSPEWAKAAAEAQGPLEFRKVLRENLAANLDTRNISDLSKLERWVAGDVWTPTGEAKIMQKVEFPDTVAGRINKAWSGFWGRTQESKATEVSNTLATNLAGMWDRSANDIDELHKMVKLLANTDLDAIDARALQGDQTATNLSSMQSLRSADARAVPLAIRDKLPTLDAMVELWHDPNQTRMRGWLDDISNVTGLSHEDILKVLAKTIDDKPVGDADVLLRQYADKAKTLPDGPGAKDLIEAINSKKLTGAVLKDMAKVFVKDGAPFDEEYLKAKYMATATYGVQEWTTKWFDVKPDPAMVRLGNTIKNIQGLFMLDLSPTFALQNSVNNMFRMTREGLFNLGSPAADRKWLDDFGVKSPSLDTSWINIINDAERTPIAEAKIDPNSPLTKVDRFVRGVRRKVGVMSKLSGADEDISALKSHRVGTERAYWTLWKPGTGYDDLKTFNPTLYNLVEQYGVKTFGEPGLAQTIMDQIGSTYSRAEMESRVFGALSRKDLSEVVPDVARQFGMEPGAVQDLLRNTGIYDFLKERIPDNATEADVYKAFADWEEHHQTQLDEQFNDYIKGEAERAANIGKAEGPVGIVHLLSEDAIDFSEQRFRDINGRQRLAEQRGMVEPSVYSQLVSQQDAIEAREWARFRRNEQAHTVGIADAFGLEEQYSLNLLDNRKLADKNWQSFWSEKRRIMDEVFKGKYDTKAEWDAAWNAAQDKITPLYERASTEDLRLSGEMHQVIIDMFAQKWGPEAAQLATNHYEASRAIDAQLSAKVTEFRDSIRNLTGQERDTAWLKYAEETWKPLLTERYKQSYGGLVEMYKKTVGAEPPKVETAPVHTPPPEYVETAHAELAIDRWKRENTNVPATREWLVRMLDEAVPNWAKGQRAQTIALMDAGARAWASLDPTRTPDQWYAENMAGFKAGTPEDLARLQGMAGMQPGIENPRGAVEMLQNNRALIYFFEGADITTGAHEVAHVFERQLSEADRQVLFDHFGDDVDALPNALVKYLEEGKAPARSTPELKLVFEKFKNWITELWDSFTKAGRMDPAAEARLTPEVRGVLDKLLVEKQKPLTPYDQFIETPRGELPEGLSKAVVNQAEALLSELHEGQPGKRLFTWTEDKSTPTVTGQTSTNAEWYRSLYFNEGQTRNSVEAALNRIIEDQGKDNPQYRNVAVVKDLIIHRLMGYTDPLGNDIPAHPGALLFLGMPDEAAKALTEWMDHYPEGAGYENMVQWAGSEEALVSLLDMLDKQVPGGETIPPEFQRGNKPLPGQLGMFNQGEELPLFSGTAQKGQESVFKPEEVGQQQTLFPMAPELKGAEVAPETPPVAPKKEQPPLFQPAPPPRTPELEQFIAGSKTVDENGDPLILYHGTTQEFSEFKRGAYKASDAGFFGDGFYLTPDPELANAYASRFTGPDTIKEGGNVMPLIARIENPFKTWDAQTVRRRFGETPAEQTKNMRAAGYDGVFKYDEANQLREVVAFDNTQVKSVFNPTPSRDNPNIMFQPQTENAPVWYSRLRRAVEAKMPAKTDAVSLRNMVVGAGVKADELKWTGFDEWLSGKKSVTKEEALKFLQENQVTLEEKTLGAKNEIRTNYDKAMQNVVAIVKEQHRASEFNAREIGQAIATGRMDLGGQISPELKVAGTELRRLYGELDNINPTKYQSYVLPGGENYREMLFKLPSPHGDEVAALKAASATVLPKYQDVYTAPHFGSEGTNLLAHTRFNDRTINGKRYLFLEEVQSDWHQTGREKGYAGPDVLRVARENESALRQQISDNTSLMVKRKAELDGKIRDDALYNQLHEDTIDLRAKLEGAQNEITRLQREQATGVPPAPFADTWHEMVMRRMIRYAAENGYDGIGWTTGKQQAARYDLAKQVDSIGYKANSDGTYMVSAQARGRGIPLGDNLTPDKLADVIGKDVANRIINGEGTKENWAANNEPRNEIMVLRGEQLTVGGEGMKSFYDRDLPNYVNKFAKKFDKGAKVGEGALTPAQGGDLKVYSSTGVDFTVYRYAEDGSREAVATFPTRAEADEFANQGVKVHAFDIPPEMKKSVLTEGVPLFQPDPADVNARAHDLQKQSAEETVAQMRKSAGIDEPTTQMTPKFMKWFGESKVVDETGAPLKVYHGTGAEFDKFSDEFVGTEFGADEKGFFFTDSPEEAGRYARNTSYGLPRDEGANVRQQYLSIKNPEIVHVDYDPVSWWDENGKDLLSNISPDKDGVIVKADKGESLYVAFSPDQIKPAYERTTLFQPGEIPDPVGDAPIDTVKGLYPAPNPKIIDEAMQTQLRPILDELKARMTGPEAKTRKSVAGAQMPPEVIKQVRQYMEHVYGQLSDTKMTAVKYGELVKEAAILDYSKRYGWDNFSNIIMPYQFWGTRSAVGWIRAFVDHPSWLVNNARLRGVQQKYGREDQPGFPARLWGKIQIPVPEFMRPKGWGPSIWVDPGHQVFDYEGIAGQLVRPMQRDQSNVERTAEYNIQALAQKNEITEQDAATALSTHAGPLWDKALAQAELTTEQEIASPLDMVGAMSSYSWPLQMAMNKITGRTERKTSGLPLFNTLQSVTSLVTPGGWNKPQEWLNRALGAPDRGFLWNYYVEREMRNMLALDPSRTPEVLKAMVDQSGPAWTEALDTVGKQQAFRNFTSTFWTDLLPEGEAKARELKQEFIKAMDAGEGAKFFDAHPEYEAQILLNDWDDPEQRMKRYLISGIWEARNNLTDLERKQADQQLGDVYQTNFLNSETRSYDSLDTATLANWYSLMSKGGELPATAPAVPQGQLQLPSGDQSARYEAFKTAAAQYYPNIDLIENMYWKLPATMQENYRAQNPQLANYWEFKDYFLGQNPDMIPYVLSKTSEVGRLAPELQQQVYQYKMEKVQYFPGIGAIQDGYYREKPGAASRAYLIDHPELRAYWDWQKQRLAQSPEIIPYIKGTETIAKGVLGKEYEPVYYPDIEKFDPNLNILIMRHVYNGAPLDSAALGALERQWRLEKKPLGTFQAWLALVMKQYEWQQ